MAESTQKETADAAAKAAGGKGSKKVKTADAAAKAEKTALAGDTKVKVKAHVNMTAKDGTEMVAGQDVELASKEVERLKSDKRHLAKPFFTEL
jgi:hypothetical protein